MPSARSIAAQRAIRPGPSLVIPKGTPTLRSVAPITTGVRNDHLSNNGANGGRGKGKAEHKANGDGGH